MKILLIEDDPVKSKDILTLLKELKFLDILQTTSFNQSKKIIRKDDFDVILLDMSLPLFDTEAVFQDFETFAGLGILDELNRLDYQKRVLVITAFDILGEGNQQIALKDLDKEMKNKYPNIYCGAIHYDATSNQWRDQLKQLLNSIINV